MESTIIIIIHFHAYFFFKTITGFLYLFFHFFFMVSFFGFIIPFCHVFTLSNIILTTYLKCLFLKSKLNITILRCALRQTDWSLLHSFKKAQVQLLQLVAQANLYASKMLIVYLFLNVPMNTYVVNLYVHNHVTGKNILFLGALALSQFNGIMGIHLFAAMLSSSIHKPAKFLLPIACKVKSVLKIQVSFLVEIWHTKNLYGLTYGKNMGLISTKAFYKYLFIYSKLLIYSYKMLRKTE